MNLKEAKQLYTRYNKRLSAIQRKIRDNVPGSSDKLMQVLTERNAKLKEDGYRIDDETYEVVPRTPMWWVEQLNSMSKLHRLQYAARHDPSKVSELIAHLAEIWRDTDQPKLGDS